MTSIYCQSTKFEMQPSVNLKDPEALKWLEALETVEPQVNAVTSLIAPDLFSAGCQSVNSIKGDQRSKNGDKDFIDNVEAWPSVFSGITVISNRITEHHTDRGAYDPAYDLLLSAGNHFGCDLEVLELGAFFSYPPGTAVAICGRFLQHGVTKWDGGHRLCYAHYLKDKVHDRNGVMRAGWQDISFYGESMLPRFYENLCK